MKSYQNSQSKSSGNPHWKRERPYHDCMEVADVAGLGKGKLVGDEQYFHCPGEAHANGDKNPSLRINTKKDSWYCQVCKAGGGPRDLVAHILHCKPTDRQAIGKWFSDRFPSPGIRHVTQGLHVVAGPQAPAPIKQISAAPPADEADLPKKLLIDREMFPVTRWFRYDGGLSIARCEYGPILEDGKREKKIRPYYRGRMQATGAPLSLFHADRLKGAKRVVIPEGELKVEKYEEAGQVATFAPNCMWSKETHRRFARLLLDVIDPNATIILDADNDTHGKDCVDEWRDALIAEEFTGILKISYALPGVGPKGDIIDFAKLYGDGWKRLIVEYHERIQPWVRPKPEIPKHLQFLTAADAMGEIEPIQWLIKGLFTTPSLNLIHGFGGAKKTWFALCGGMCVAAGIDFLGHSVKKIPVLWVDEESGKTRLLSRMADVIHGLMVSPDIPFFATSFVGFNLADPASESFAHLKEAIQKTGAGFVILDALCDITAGLDENAAKEVGPVMYKLRQLAEELQVCFLVIHHSAKSGSYRGSTVLQSAPDCVLKIESAPKDRFINISFEKARDVDGTPIRAEAHFLPGEFYLSISNIPDNTHNKLTEPQRYVLKFLESRPGGMATMDEIREGANPEDPEPSCTPTSAQKAVWELAKNRVIENITRGGGRGQKATYKIGGKTPTDDDE